MRLTVNGTPVDVAAQPDEALLWVIREKLKLTGTKFGAVAALTGVRMRRLPMTPPRVLAALRERA